LLLVLDLLGVGCWVGIIPRTRSTRPGTGGYCGMPGVLLDAVHGGVDAGQDRVDGGAGLPAWRPPCGEAGPRAVRASPAGWVGRS